MGHVVWAHDFPCLSPYYTSNEERLLSKAPTIPGYLQLRHFEEVPRASLEMVKAAVLVVWTESVSDSTGFYGSCCVLRPTTIGANGVVSRAKLEWHRRI